jgi:hypothetical protein
MFDITTFMKLEPSYDLSLEKNTQKMKATPKLTCKYRDIVFMNY